jgi:hypothetical protein
MTASIFFTRPSRARSRNWRAATLKVCMGRAAGQCCYPAELSDVGTTLPHLQALS